MLASYLYIIINLHKKIVNPCRYFLWFFHQRKKAEPYKMPKKGNAANTIFKDKPFKYSVIEFKTAVTSGACIIFPNTL